MLVVGKLNLGGHAKMSVETHSVRALSRPVREAGRSIRQFGQTAHATYRVPRHPARMDAERQGNAETRQVERQPATDARNASALPPREWGAVCRNDG